MRVLVTGGRVLTMEQREALREALDALHVGRAVTLIIEGGASGADSVARGWALRNGVGKVTIYADWGTWKLQAGPRRNEEMLLQHNPDLVLAAPGKSGTLDCVGKAQALGIPVLQLEG